MLSPAKLAANQANARKSTGPTTEAGKAAVALNPVRHGLTAVTPVIAGEDPGEWDAHRAATVAALAPCGHLEYALADRAAALLWRLGRVVRYEAAVTSAGIADKAEAGEARDWVAEMVGPRAESPGEKLAAARKWAAAARADATAAARAADWLAALPARPGDEAVAAVVVWEAHAHVAGELQVRCPDPAEKAFLAAIGSPAKSVRAVAWTAGMVRDGVGFYAAAAGVPADEYLTGHAARLRGLAADRAVDAEGGEARARELAARAAAAAELKRAKLVLPDALVLQKIARYEATSGGSWSRP